MLFFLIFFLSSDIRPSPVPPTVGPIVPSARQQVPTQYIVIGSAAGGNVLLLVVIVVIIVIIAVHARRRRSMRSEYNVMCKLINYSIGHVLFN